MNGLGEDQPSLSFAKMWPPSVPPKTIQATVGPQMPESFRRTGHSEHSINQKRGKPLDCFIEGPTVVCGTLYVTDIPYGRIFAVDLGTDTWTLVIEYDGEPNGLAWHPQRQRLLIADFKQGLLELDLETRSISPLMTRFNGERFKGVNDVIVSSKGDILFTDQGMTGLHDPTGRVFRLRTDGSWDILLQNCPSPNGLVLDKSESMLFVAMTRDNSVWHVPLYPDGRPQRTGRFASYYGIGGPDGMTSDSEGNIFVAHSTLGAVFVHRANGEPFAKIESPGGHGTTNLTWGGLDGNLLYITESQKGAILVVNWHCPGILSGKLAPETSHERTVRQDDYGRAKGGLDMS